MPLEVHPPAFPLFSLRGPSRGHAAAAEDSVPSGETRSSFFLGDRSPIAGWKPDHLDCITTPAPAPLPPNWRIRPSARALQLRCLDRSFGDERRLPMRYAEAQRRTGHMLAATARA